MVPPEDNFALLIFPLFPKVNTQTQQPNRLLFFYPQNLLSVNAYGFCHKKTHLTKVDGFVHIVVPPGIEPGTHGFSVRCSTN